MKICEVCNSPIGLERLQMQPRVITCSPACTTERKLAMGRARAQRHYQKRKQEGEEKADGPA